MPTTLGTTICNITDSVSNTVNSELLSELHSYMKINNASERHQNNTLKVMIAYAVFSSTNQPSRYSNDRSSSLYVEYVMFSWANAVCDTAAGRPISSP